MWTHGINCQFHKVKRLKILCKTIGFHAHKFIATRSCTKWHSFFSRPPKIANILCKVHGKGWERLVSAFSILPVVGWWMGAFVSRRVQEPSRRTLFRSQFTCWGVTRTSYLPSTPVAFKANMAIYCDPLRSIAYRPSPRSYWFIPVLYQLNGATICGTFSPYQSIWATPR